jgi:hypothetical protein
MGVLKTDQKFRSIKTYAGISYEKLRYLGGGDFIGGYYDSGGDPPNEIVDIFRMKNNAVNLVKNLDTQVASDEGIRLRGITFDKKSFLELRGPHSTIGGIGNSSVVLRSNTWGTMKSNVIVSSVQAYWIDILGRNCLVGLYKQGARSPSIMMIGRYGNIIFEIQHPTITGYSIEGGFLDRRYLYLAYGDSTLGGILRKYVLKNKTMYLIDSYTNSGVVPLGGTTDGRFFYFGEGNLIVP